MQLITETEKLFISQGAINRKRLRAAAARAVTNKDHTYIYSPPGLGKTYTIEDEFNKNAANWVPIKGNTSLWGFITDIAMIVANKDDSDIIVFIDDCDTLLTQTDSINTMKIALNDGVPSTLFIAFSTVQPDWNAFVNNNVQPPPSVVISAYIWKGVPPLILGFAIQYNPSVEAGKSVLI